MQLEILLCVKWKIKEYYFFLLIKSIKGSYYWLNKSPIPKQSVGLQLMCKNNNTKESIVKLLKLRAQ